MPIEVQMSIDVIIMILAMLFAFEVILVCLIFLDR